MSAKFRESRYCKLYFLKLQVCLYIRTKLSSIIVSYITSCQSVFIVYFKQVNASWVKLHFYSTVCSGSSLCNEIISFDQIIFNFCTLSHSFCTNHIKEVSSGELEIDEGYDKFVLTCCLLFLFSTYVFQRIIYIFLENTEFSLLSITSEVS